MAKLKTDPIGQTDMIEYLATQSDLAFEMRILHRLLELGFECEHGGTYDDPVSGKPRQFDIRANRAFGHGSLRLAVECKNVREHFPLLISCVPRREIESFHEVILAVDTDMYHIGEGIEEPMMRANALPSISVRVTGETSLYAQGQPVGKSCDQVGRNQAGEIVASDSDVYEKWSQALGSAYSLFEHSTLVATAKELRMGISLVIPVVVVPDNRLWRAVLNADTGELGEPESVSRCSYFVDRKYLEKSGVNWESLTLSHLEFVTESGLHEMLQTTDADTSLSPYSLSFPYVVERVELRFVMGSRLITPADFGE